MERPNSAYWARRAAMRMIDYQAEAETVANDLGKAYAAANKSMQREMHRIFSNFQRAFKISESQAKQIISAVGNESAMKALQAAALKIPDPETQKLAMDALTSAPAYSWRIARLDDMLDDVEQKCSDIYHTDLAKTTDFLGSIARTAYTRTAYDYRVLAGVLQADFVPMGTSLVNTILATNWSGTPYSERIYQNVEDMQTKLKQTLLEAVMTGESEYKLAEKISTRWQIGYNDARRLIRTETTYVSNQAELASYKEIGIEEYKYEAVLDSATSEICRELHGKKFKISEAKPGKNYPPIHPWCRSTTMAVIPEIPEITEEQDNAIEGWLNDEEDLDYEEWCEKHHISPKTGKKVYQGNSKSAKAAQATQEQPKAAIEPKMETVSEQPKSGAQKQKTAKKSPKSGVAADYSYGHTAEFETTIPTIDTIDTPTVKTTEKIYTDEVAKRVKISRKKENKHVFAKN